MRFIIFFLAKSRNKSICHILSVLPDSTQRAGLGPPSLSVKVSRVPKPRVAVSSCLELRLKWVAPGMVYAEGQTEFALIFRCSCECSILQPYLSPSTSWNPQVATCCARAIRRSLIKGLHRMWVYTMLVCVRVCVSSHKRGLALARQESCSKGALDKRGGCSSPFGAFLPLAGARQRQEESQGSWLCAAVVLCVHLPHPRG